MSVTIPDIVVPSNEYVDINTLAGITVGGAMVIMNKGNYNIMLQESVLKPADTSEDGVPVTNVYSSFARADVATGSIRIWARAIGTGVSCKISVQKV